jgi:Ca2+-binding RTX toxin-like protein
MLTRAKGIKVQIEHLEARVVLSVSLLNGQLTIVGTGDPDSVSLHVNSSGALALVFNGVATNFALAKVQKISISTAGGNDTVTLTDSINIPATINGGSANDSLRGGGGADVLFGTTGDDTLDGGAGSDQLVGGSGIDTADYSSRKRAVKVTLDGIGNDGQTNENDNVSVENVRGGNGSNKLTGDASANFLTGGAANDILNGAGGNDTLDGQAGADQMIGGPGNDTVTYASRTNPVSITIDDAANDGESGEGDLVDPSVETVIGGSGNDSMIAESIDGFGNYMMLPVLFEGGPGNDTLGGGIANDTLMGGPGDDAVDGSGGNGNLLFGDDGNDLLTVDVGADGDFGSGTINGGAGNDTITSGALGSGAKEMHGGPGDDVLLAHGNAQIVTGDAGNDVANYQEVFHFSSTTVIDLTGTGIETLIGSEGNDSVIGTDAAETILGESGDDTVLGNGGNDYIDGGAGLDMLMGGAGDDTFVNADGGEPDHVDGGDGFNIAEFDGFADPVHQIPNDSLTNIEFIYDPDSSAPAPPLGTILSRSAAPLAAAGGSLAGGVLTIAGTSGNDSISVILDSTGHNIQVTFNGTATLYPLISVKSISIDGGNGNDSIALIKSNGTRIVPVVSTILGGAGNDTITGGSGVDVIQGGDGDDLIHGGDGNDSLVGGLGNDTIYGDGGNDLLNGGVETLGVNSDGADHIFGGLGNDSAIYSYRTDNLIIDISDSKKSNDGGKSEGDNVAADIENVFSGNGNDSIAGNASSNLICGGGGNDTLMGGDGNDKLIGSRGDDLLVGGAGRNLFSIADGIRDDFDSTPATSFVSGDPHIDFSTVTGTVI